MTNPNEEKAFFPKEAVKELAKLRALQVQQAKEVDKFRSALEDMEEYMDLVLVEGKLKIIQKELLGVEAAFKAGCENIFEETDEKKFPGGQIKMKSTIDYIEATAINWAIKHEHVELLSLVKGKFKKMCSGINPLYGGNAFVTKAKVGKLYIDSDLSQYLEE